MVLEKKWEESVVGLYFSIYTSWMNKLEKKILNSLIIEQQACSFIVDWTNSTHTHKILGVCFEYVHCKFERWIKEVECELDIFNALTIILHTKCFWWNHTKKNGFDYQYFIYVYIHLNDGNFSWSMKWIRF